MLRKIIKNYLGRDQLRVLRLLGFKEYIKFFIFKILKKLYLFKYNEIRIILRPWIKSDISGILGLLKHSNNNYLDDIRVELENEKPKNKIVFFDLGANIGLDSLSACVIFPNLNCLNIIEMDTDNLEIAKINIEQFNNKNVKYINKAIWTDSNSIVEYSIDQESNAFSVGGIKKQGKCKQCQTISMEELIVNENLNDKIVILKMDVEGVEKNIIYQKGNPWLKSLNYFYVEYHGFNENDKNVLLSVVREYGLELINKYDYWSFDGWGGMLFGRSANLVKL